MDALAHDTLFKTLVENRQSSDSLLRRYLPPKLVARMTDRRPKPLQARLIRVEGSPLELDALFEITIADEVAIGVHMWLIDALLEHKSWNDRSAPLQLLRYMSERWAFVAQEDGLGSLRPIVPVIIFHGSETCTIPESFLSLFRLPDGLASELKLLDFGITVHHLSQIETPRLADDSATRSVLTAMKLRHVDDLPFDVVEEMILGLLDRPADSLVRRVGLQYIGSVLSISETTRQKLLDSRDLEVRTVGMTMAEAWREEGREEARKEALKEARKEARGEARRETLCETLRELLIHRFGPVENDVDARIRRASEAELKRWILAASEAGRPEELFGPNGSH